MVLSSPSILAEVDRSRTDCDCLWAAGMEPSLHREELDGYRCDASTAQVGHAWTLSLGPTSVL